MNIVSLGALERFERCNSLCLRVKIPCNCLQNESLS